MFIMRKCLCGFAKYSCIISFRLLSIVESSVRQRVVNVLRIKYKTLEEAEEKCGLSIEAILHGTTVAETPTKMCPVSFLSKLKNFTAEQFLDITKECLQFLHPQCLVDVLSKSLLQHAGDIMPAFTACPKEAQVSFMDKMFANLASSCGINAKLSKFISLSVKAMKTLQDAGKNNLIYKWAKCIVGENGKPLIALDRMPFGLIEYQMEFFTATNVMQVCT